MSLTNDEINLLIDAAENQASHLYDNGYRYEHFSSLEKDKEYGRQQIVKSNILRNIMKKLEGMKEK